MIEQEHLDDLDSIREAADAAWAKINRNPDRINELPEHDLHALARNVATCRPMAQQMLIMQCGGDPDAACAVFLRALKVSPKRLEKLVRRGFERMSLKLPLNDIELAAILIDFTVGCNAVALELDRRASPLN
jgi:hypothetical protein